MNSAHPNILGRLISEACDWPRPPRSMLPMHHPRLVKRRYWSSNGVASELLGLASSCKISDRFPREEATRRIFGRHADRNNAKIERE